MISIQSQVEPMPVAAAVVKRAAAATLSHQGTQGDLTVVLSNDDHLRELNRDYLREDAPTDVLSFPAGDSDPETGVRYLGDVIISLERARLQARAAGHSLEAEVQLLVAHGVLHLLGHDHAAATEKRRMWAAQNEILARLGVNDLVSRE